MAGAVEKRKATLAAKKAAQVAAEQKAGTIASKPAKIKPIKKEPGAPRQQHQHQTQSSELAQQGTTGAGSPSN